MEICKPGISPQEVLMADLMSQLYRLWTVNMKIEVIIFD